MTSSDPYAAKRALFALLDANNGPSQALDGIQVAYAFPRAVEMRCIYGGGIRFEHAEDVAETPGMLVRETVLISVYIRVVTRPPEPVEDTDSAAATIGAAVLQLVKATATPTSPLRWVGVRSGQGDYQNTDDEAITVLGYQFQFISRVTY